MRIRSFGLARGTSCEGRRFAATLEREHVATS
jgi:hypothetical protein